MITFPNLIRFQAICETTGVQTPTPVLRALALRDVAFEHSNRLTRSLLDLADDEVPDVVTDLAIRRHTEGIYGGVGMSAGVDSFETQLLNETTVAVVPLLDELVADLRPKFIAAAAPIVLAAREYGFTSSTDADSILLRADWTAAEAVLAARAAWPTVNPIIAFRQQLSEIFDVSPTTGEARGFYGSGDGYVDYSVCFAPGDRWSDNGAMNLAGKLPGPVDLVAIAGDGVTLNTPSEVRAKVYDRWKNQVAPAVPEADTDTETDDSDDLDAERIPASDLVQGPKYPAPRSR